ncbi:hypothetical protein T03_5873 [Trichinella britovi]|uniref:DUF7041 domain-containing protein n=2 Tax=Trichinella TaxID=6333 RepID=A0A0V1CAC8_TRIBR|nr:hypothetical protein T05_9358 [Trichinella murrelli]KRX52462.1 hypothetical protein T09_6035 [Trichinella sp. T9]KRX59044.1 hypothetical protein T09_5552 [Trichinella sp. T9]KRY45982.1 hypothetical protein T03_5873 [Trichinella britovi]KRZ86456.1 hypothetical protein T08_7248 [Trichinella sp. T8]
MKLPTYWTSQCHVWYKQVDAQLHICQMFTDTIHYYILRALHQKTADFVRHPPATYKYLRIKAFLTNIIGIRESEQCVNMIA